MKDKKYKTCLRCGRRLKTDKARQLGYGDTCYRKIMGCNKSSSLFDINKSKKN